MLKIRKTNADLILDYKIENVKDLIEFIN